MNWCISPSFVKESTVFVERGEVVDVGFASEPIQVADFEVGPLEMLDEIERRMRTYEMAFVVGFSFVITEPVERVVLVEVFGMFLHEFLDTIPECFDGLTIFVETEDEAVFLLVVDHVFEWIVVDIAEEFDAWFNSPVPFVVLHERLLEEETRFEPTHMSVTD